MNCKSENKTGALQRAPVSQRGKMTYLTNTTGTVAW